MTETYFEILRAGTNSSIQDKGRKNLYHIGITISGAMDQKIFKLSNALVNNNLDEGVIEFAYQGPLLKLKNGSVNFAITGNIDFNILRKNSIIEKGECFQSYLLEKDEQLDIIYTKESVFGYLAIEGGFKIEKVWNSYSVNTKAKIGPNDGEKFSVGEKIYLNKSEAKNFVKKSIEYKNLPTTTIRTIKGTNFDYFSSEAKNNFFNKQYQVTNLTDRMGMRLEGPKLKNIVNTNIKSEGLVKGVVQVPADGNPIIMFADHGSIGGYPKIAVVITADHDKAAQLTPGSKIQFKEVNLDEAESLFKTYSKDIKICLEKIK